jgi:hypothetical protein
MDASTNLPLHSLGTIPVNGIGQGRNSSSLTNVLRQFAGRSVYLQAGMQNSNSSVQYHIRNYYHQQGSSLPKQAGEMDIAWNAGPLEYELAQNYPNPFNPSTEISYSIPLSGNVRISVLNSLGREVAVLVDKLVEAGSHTITFDGSILPSGVYMYTMVAGDSRISKKMTLVK